ncbi:MAG: FtsW/RodA/SpoVE family cell cycle protein [Armatimonadota bacterium]
MLLASAASVLLLGTCLRVATISRETAWTQTVAAPSPREATPPRPPVSRSVTDPGAETSRQRAVGLQWRATAWLLGAMAIAHALKRKFRPNADPYLIPSGALLASIGNLAIAGCKDPLRDAPAMLHHAEGVAIATAAGCLVASAWFVRKPLHRYGYIAATAAIGFLVLLAIAGRGPGGVRLSVFGFQPAELVRGLTVVFTAAYLAARGAGHDRPTRLTRTDVVPLAVLIAIPVGLFILLKDMGPVVLLIGAILAMTFVATHRFRWLALGCIAVLFAGFLAYAMGIGTLPTRIGMWWSPWNNPYRGGDHLASALWTAASGGWFGSGIGLGDTHRLPRAGSDMVLASILGEGGLPAGLATIAAAAVPGWRSLRIAATCRTRFDRLLAAGLGALISLQSSLIAAGSLGLAPLSGVSFPWAAYGSSALVVQGICLGLLLALSDREPSHQIPTMPAPFRSLSLVHLMVHAGLGLRCLHVTGVVSGAIAVQPFEGRARDATRLRRINPRLMSTAAKIPRGDIVDDRGRMLATGSGSSRTYPLGSDGAFATGWISVATGLGEVGSERRNDAVLRGWSDEGDLLALWRMRALPWRREPRGATVRMDLDASWQRLAARLMRQTPTRRGAIVMLDTTCADPRISVSLPAAEPARALRTTAAKDLASGTLVDRVEAGRFAPGSTFKIVTAAALLAMGEGGFRVPCRHVSPTLRWSHDGRKYRRGPISDDRGESAHGSIGLDEALAVSCNIFFAQAAMHVGAERLRSTALAMGLPMPTTRIVASSLPDTGIGQGALAVSPASMARAVLGLVAAAHGSVNETGLASRDARRILDAMIGAVDHGTAIRTAIPGRRIGAKTGTAQTGAGREPHAWLVGFEERIDRTLVFAVLVENAGYGGGVASPIARTLLEQSPSLK